MEQKIDIVLPYVDNTDRVWQKNFYDFCIKHQLQNKIADLHTARYEDIGLINYQLRLIEKYMPWVNTIYLLLSNKEQAPQNLPSKVKVILHEEFIPFRFLPTFNSTTIEMFLWNLPKLSEYFIYMNDDMLPFKPLTEDMFFTEDGHIKIEWWKEDFRECKSMFRYQCLNSYNHVCTRLGIKHDGIHYIRPAHSFTPMRKSHCIEVFNLLKEYMFKHIRAFRTEYQYNQYIYPIYEHLRYKSFPANIDFLYTQLEDKIDLDHDIVCLNIVPRNKEKELIKELEKRL